MANAAMRTMDSWTGTWVRTSRWMSYSLLRSRRTRRRPIRLARRAVRKPCTVCWSHGQHYPKASMGHVLGEVKRHATLRIAVAGCEHLRRLVEGEQVVDFV